MWLIEIIVNLQFSNIYSLLLIDMHIYVNTKQSMNFWNVYLKFKVFIIIKFPQKLKQLVKVQTVPAEEQA